MEIVLASKSPRRRELLRQIGVKFRQIDIDVAEVLQSGEPSDQYVKRLALSKARAGLSGNSSEIVMGADTIVCIDDSVLEKPRDFDDFRQMLRLLSGRQHDVKTAVALVGCDREVVECSVSQVFFRDIGPEEIDRYWHTGEPLDKAGGYAIQGFGAVFVEKIHGSYSGIVGLPIEVVSTMLLEFGISIWGCEAS